MPGRLCLFGEHSDWAAGYRKDHPEISPGACLVAGTDQGITAEAEPHPDALEIISVLPSGEEMGPARIAADPVELAAAAGGADFFSYVAGTAACVRRRHDVQGLRLRVSSDLPVRKGLSSSAAISVLTARAYSEVYGLGLSRRDEMALAYEGERLTGSECGRMDQVCAYGRRVTRVHFDADQIDVEDVAPGATLYLLIVDLRRAKDTRRILSDLNACYPATAGVLPARVRDALGPKNLVVHRAASAAIEAGDAVALGGCMVEAQRIFDVDVAPACPELASPALHAMLDHPAVRDWATGAKGVGSQGDGCGQVVVPDESVRRRLAERLETDLGVRTYGLTLLPDGSSVN